jgi:hypothetical protein
MHDDNPYAPPEAANRDLIVDVDASWYLLRIQKYFRRMGIGGLIYVSFLIVFLTISQLSKRNFQIPEIVGPLVGCGLLAWFFIAMIRIGQLPEDQFPKHYKKARWLAIFAGTLFLPILGLPAFISLRRLTMYNEMQKNNPNRS